MGIIRDKIPHFEFSIPVAVIGAGACGLSAALAVRDAGVEVLVFERDERPWGSTSMSLGAACAAGSASQAAAGVDDSAERFVADILAKTEGRADAALARVIADRSGPTVDWLATHQVPMLLDFKWTGLGHSKPRLHIPPGRNGEELLTLLLNACARAGAEVMTSARVVDLYADADDRVLGLRIARPNGEFEEIGCEAVVIATCGFGADHAMVAENIPEMANAKYFGHEGNQGDGIRFGAALGGALADMTAYQGLGTLADPQQVLVPHPLMIEGGFLVNTEGVRFTHELANISGMCVPVLAQPGGIAWVVFDARCDRLPIGAGSSASAACRKAACTPPIPRSTRHDKVAVPTVTVAASKVSPRSPRPILRSVSPAPCSIPRADCRSTPQRACCARTDEHCPMFLQGVARRVGSPARRSPATSPVPASARH